MNRNEMKYNWDWGMDSTAFCCGLKEVGNIDAYQYEWASCPKKTASEILLDMRENARTAGHSFPIMINMVSYTPKAFRDLVKKQKDAKLVHKWKNPNSGNIIECWILTNGSKQRWKKN